MAKLYDVVSHGGTYQKDGEEKTRWIRHGAVFEKDGKLSMKLDSIAIQGGEDAGWYKLFESNRNNQQQPAPAQSAPPQPADPSDEIPF